MDESKSTTKAKGKVPSGSTGTGDATPHAGAGRRAGGTSTGAPGLPGAYRNLPPTARRLLEGARRLLARSGYNSLSVEAIGREADESKTLIGYYFGSKNGLLVALVQWILYDRLWDLRMRLSVPNLGEDGLGVIIAGVEEELADAETYRLFFDLLPRLAEDPAMAAQLAELYREIRDLMLRGLWGDSRGDAPDVVCDLAAMTVALIDGLGAQLMAEPASINVPRVIRLWRVLLERTLEAAAEPHHHGSEARRQ